MQEYPCIPCQFGDHSGHIDYPELPPPGVMGGQHCPCKGDCGDNPLREVRAMAEEFEEHVGEQPMSTFFPPDDIRRPDPQLSHLKSMAAIVAMIEHMRPGEEITITAVNQPMADGIYWSLRRLIDEREFDVDAAPGPRNAVKRPEPVYAPPCEAHKLLEREIAEREHDLRWRGLHP